MAQPNDGVCCNVFTDCCGPDALTERWDVRSGDWSVVSSALTPNGAGVITTKKGLCKCDKILISVSTSGFNIIGEKFRLLFDYVDSSTYKYIEYEITSLTPVLVKITYGANGSPIDIIEGVTFTPCCDTSYIICITEYNIHVIEGIVFTYNGLNGGITGIQHLNGNQTYRNYLVRRYVGYDNPNVNDLSGQYCTRCRIGCTKCENFRMSKQIKVEISGVVAVPGGVVFPPNPNDPCLTCSAWNSVFYLDKIDTCEYEFETSIPHCCHPSTVPVGILTLTYSISLSSNEAWLTFTVASGGPSVVFKKNISNPHNCYDEFVDEEFTLYVGQEELCLCGFSSAIIKITNIN